MVERIETVEKHGVIFIIFDGQKIQLEERICKEDQFYGFTLIPGGKVESKETLQDALKREVNEEYGVKVVKNEWLGIVRSDEKNGCVNYRYVYLVSEWEGDLSNPEGKNNHIERTIQEARKICEHPISQQILDLIERRLS